MNRFAHAVYGLLIDYKINLPLSHASWYVLGEIEKKVILFITTSKLLVLVNWLKGCVTI